MASNISEKARPAALAILIKHHFWMLAVLVPLVLLPLLFMALGTLKTEIGAMREQINGSLTALKNVRLITQHPNQFWEEGIDQSTMRVKRETYTEWVRFWQSQRAFRTWPASLGPDFVKAAESLKPDGKLSRQLLERYQNNVKQLVQELPKRMGVEPAMLDAQAMAELRGGGPAAPVVRGGPGEPGQPGVGPQQSSFVAVWSPDNQRRIYESFIWEKTPSTLKVVMAQEDLRIYGMLCDVIRAMNEKATGPHNAPIAAVNELAIGYPAAEDDPGGAAAGRLTRVAAAPVAGGEMGMAMGSAPGAPGMAAAGGGRPPNPRFVGLAGASGMMGSMPMGSGPGGPGDPSAADPAAANPDDQLFNWVYCDFQGKPLDAATLATSPDAQMVHLMPFVMRLVIDQRQIDPLLERLATQLLPIDVRQVRINASSGSGPGGSMGSMSGMGGMSGMGSFPGSGSDMSMGGVGAFGGDAPTGAVRLYDVQLELRGTIGIATRPSEQAVGLEPGQGSAPAPSGDGKEKPAKAAGLLRSTRGRVTS